MNYKIKDSKRKHMIEAYDKENNLVGEALISPFMDSDLAETPRLNIYIDIVATDISNEGEIKDQLFDEVMKRSLAIKKENSDIDVRVYHCCFSDNQKNIDYFSSKQGFKHDEGMHIIKKVLTEDKFEIADIKGINFVKLEFDNEEEIAELIEKQNQVFASGYTLEDIKNIKMESQWFSIAAKSENELVGNIIIIVKKDETDTNYGWVDDLFVSKGWRNRGIGENLILRAFEELLSMGIRESALEVWSANKRASSVYAQLGYQFLKETESSIGMFL